MSPKKPTMTVDPKDMPVTHAQLAQLEFGPVKELRDLTKDERQQKILDAVERVRPMAVLAAGLLVKEKSDLIALVDEQYDDFGPFLMELAHAHTAAKALVDIIGAGEVRLAAALANVEEDDESA
jgi:hypothetical protein